MSDKFAIESLESRTLLAGVGINYPNFSSTGHLVGNGFGADVVTVANRLRMTSGQNYQARSVWYDRAVPIENFRVDFTFQIAKTEASADGLTFALINGATNSVGGDGRDLGFGGMGVKSAAIAFDQYNFYAYGSKFGFANDSQKPATAQDMNSLDLHSGHVFSVTETYDGKVLRVSVKDMNTQQVFGASEKIDLVKQLGTNTAIIGFTAATGANRSTQDILSWSYSGNNTDPNVQPAPAPVPTAPTFAVSANANPGRVTGTSTKLSALASDQIDDAGSLPYKWRVMSMPAGAVAPTFSKNGTNVARSTTVHFAKDGVYTFRCTVTNSSGLSSSSSVSVRVSQTATSIAVAPHKKSIKVDQRIQYSATMFDQFGRAMRTQPTFAYSIQSGGGKITSSGLYVAPPDITHTIVQASALSISGVAGLTVYPHDEQNTVGAGS